MMDVECYINNMFDDFETIETYETLSLEFDPMQDLLRIPTDPFSISRKWFVYDDEEDEERYDEDW